MYWRLDRTVADLYLREMRSGSAEVAEGDRTAAVWQGSGSKSGKAAGVSKSIAEAQVAQGKKAEELAANGHSSLRQAH